MRSRDWLLLAALLFVGRRAAVKTTTRAPGANALTLAELRDLASSVGFPDPYTAAAVAMAESGGDPSIVGDDGTSFGLWQVNAPSHPEFDASKLMDATYNARAAFLISKGGTDWHLWTQYRNGKYRQYLPGA